MKRLKTIVIAGVTGALLACGVTEPEEGPPVLPPESTFTLDFSDFQSSPLVADGMAGASAQPGANWGVSAVTVGVWNTLLTAALITPVAAFVAAVNETPSWEGDHWAWRYDFQAFGVGHVARLEATPTTGGFNWAMFISGGNFDNFQWYTGFSALDGSNGSWSLQASPQNPTPFMDIDWTRDATAGTGTIRYTNVIPGNADNGGYIDFSTEPVEGFDRWYQLHSPSAQATVDIQWNSVTKDGRLRAPAHFGDSDWRCWDSNLDDVACP